MKKLTLTGKELREIGFPEAPVISIAMQVMQKNYKHTGKDEVLTILKNILEQPLAYKSDAVLGLIAAQLIPSEEISHQEIPLNVTGVGYQIFGHEHIEEGALTQMNQAVRLPISVTGALMPDAHSGYGLPIGGVLATKNAVIPYGVGVDIGCRMCLSLYPMNPDELISREQFFARAIQEATYFGSGAQFDEPADHPVLEHSLFHEIPLLKQLHGKARKQLGTSGSGNHFAEFGVVTIHAKDEVLGVEPGKYIGFLTHSGSRGLGANIANHYTQLAISRCKLPAEAKNLAWLDLSDEGGMEYWLSMNLAGEYASACHHTIHDKISSMLPVQSIKMVENHHNFAWKETWEGEEVIVHRKGATPAGKDVLGIIPGSMTADGFIVKGKGESASINSAAHGAGRKMSRTRAIQSVTDKEFQTELKKFGVKLLGGGLDESPFAYKDIHQVMQSQKGLVEVLGNFTPKIVKMDGAKHRSWKSKNKGEVMGE